MTYCLEIAKQAKKASQIIAKTKSEQKNSFFSKLASLIQSNEAYLLEENQKDLIQAQKNNLDQARIQRLALTPKIIEQMVEACLYMEKNSDPIGAIEEAHLRPNSMQVGKMRIPLGVICMIYEARPNVTIDASILCVKAGNAVILRGGSEAIYSNLALEKVLHEALETVGLPKEIVQLLHQTQRQLINELCTLDEYIDVIIPRGGEELIKLVSSQARMPVLKHDKGVCHAYIDQSADLDASLEIVYNSKVQRPSACNALETLLVHKNIAEVFLAKLEKRLAEVELRACPKSIKYLSKAKKLQESDKGQEFHALVLAVLVVEDFDQALEHIQKYNSKHTDIICTNDYAMAQRFILEVDASTVAVNASSRFNDGGELGLGAEIGISTSKLHAYGVMGVKELTSTKFVITGNYQIRQD